MLPLQKYGAGLLVDGPEVDCADPAGLLVADIATIRGECEEVLLKRELLLHITIGLEAFLLVALCTYRVIVSVWRITGVGAVAALSLDILPT